MAQARRTWTYRPAKPPAPTLPARLKDEVQAQAQTLLEAVLIPRHIKPPPKDMRFNYLAGLSLKWWRHDLYFCSTYCSPGPNAIAPTFESRFARLEYAGGERFDLAFLRHTGKWITIHRELTLAEALATISEDPWFIP